MDEEEPLEKETLNQFTETMMPGCMSLLDNLPESVYRICDLLVVVANRNGDKWRDDILNRLVAEVIFADNMGIVKLLTSYTILYVAKKNTVQ